MLLCFLLVLILQQFSKDRAGALGILLSLALAFFCFGFRGYQNQYSMREYEIQDALSHGGIDQAQNLCVTDCTQQYLIRFLFGITCENTQIEGADLVLLDKRMTDPDFDEMVWEFYHYYDTIPWDYMEEAMDIFQIIMGIEEEFDIEIANEEAEKIRTVGDAVEKIKNALNN